jgi:hypothetical protein
MVGPDFGAKMIRTLKITSMLIAISAVGFIVFLVVFGLRGDRQIEEFLKAPGAIEKFKKLAKTTDQDQDQTSPLFKHAKAFALRINPPPPVKPKQPKAAPRKQVAKKAPPPKPKAPVRAKFKLVATCRYEQQSGRSLALLDRPPQGPKWYRQGDKVGHLTIEQVKDGSIICSDGQELFVPPIKKGTKTLLKSELIDSRKPQPATTVTLEQEKTLVTPSEEMETLVSTPAQPPQETRPTLAKPQPDPAERRRIRRLPPRRPRQLPAQPTPEQRTETLEKSISTIKEMMSRSVPSLEDEENEKELKVWEQLLESLEKERNEIEKAAD